MRGRSIKLVAIQTAPQQGIHFEPWDHWPPELVLFEAGVRETDFRPELYPIQTLGDYLSSALSPWTVGGERLAAQIVGKAADKVGAWITERGSKVTAALEADEAAEYMILVVTDEPCRQVIRLRIEFHDDPGE